MERSAMVAKYRLLVVGLNQDGKEVKIKTLKCYRNDHVVIERRI